MNEKEINDAFDREYEIHSKDPVYRIIRACGMSTANSDINVFALEKIIAGIKAEEREACAQLCESIAKPEENIYYTAPLIDIAIAAIRARGGEMKDGIALESIAHPEGNPVPDDHEIDPDSLETVEIEIPMNERIKQLAEQIIGFEAKSSSLTFSPFELERFAELICQDEREANIKLLEDFSNTGMVPVKDTWRMGLIAGANAIRGRTE
jgi:hypothetical protein